MNPVIEAMIARRSCKNFLPDPVPRELIDEIIEAGLFAASGLNKQSPIILAVTDPETRDLLERLNSRYDSHFHREKPFYGAPVVLAVLADKSAHTCTYDGSLVMGNLMLAAHTLGVGSCWIHRGLEVFEDPEGKALLEQQGITGDYEGIAFCVLGYPAAKNDRILPRKEGRIYWIP